MILKKKLLLKCAHPTDIYVGNDFVISITLLISTIFVFVHMVNSIIENIYFNHKCIVLIHVSLKKIIQIIFILTQSILTQINTISIIILTLYFNIIY